MIPGGGRSPRPRDRNEGDSAGFRLFAPVDHPTDALFGGEGEEHEGRSLGPGPGYGGPVGAFLGVASLTYDADQRLVGTTGNLFGRTRYTYDAANNLLAVHNSRHPFTGYYNAANELIAASGRTLTYNADGELTNDGARTYTWDAAYRLVAVRDGTGTITTFAYNGLDERVATITHAGQAAPVTTDTLWCGITICAAFTPSGTLTAQYFPQGALAYYEQAAANGSLVARSALAWQWLQGRYGARKIAPGIRLWVHTMRDIAKVCKEAGRSDERVLP